MIGFWHSINDIIVLTIEKEKKTLVIIFPQTKQTHYTFDLKW